MVGGDGVLPDRAARRLRLRPPADALCATRIGRRPRCGDGCRLPDLPLAVAAGWGKPPAAGEAVWLIALFAASIGLPFFALAANGPLLQAWFTRTAHPAAKDPYFLYAISNVGSLLALVAYPLVVEPLSRLSDQTLTWSIGFYILIALIAGGGYLSWRADDRRSDTAAGVAEAAAPTRRDAAIWVALAAVPSGLLVGVTAHISTDIAVVPLDWPRQEPDPNQRVWTDDYPNIVGALLRKLKD